MVLTPHTEGLTGMGWSLCPHCGREAEWDEARSDDTKLAGELVLYCNRCKVEGRVRRDQVGKIPVKWASLREGPHLPELEDVQVTAGKVPGGVSVTVRGDRHQVLKCFQEPIQVALVKLHPEALE